MADYLLEMRGITKEFSGVKAIDGIDIAVRPGECVGLCGENGAGKSTLMKVLSAVYPHGTWSGTISWEGRELKARTIRETEEAGIVIIHQELMMVPHLSVAENIFLGSEPTTFGGFIDYDAMNARAAELMTQLKMPDVNVALPVMAYSGGKQQLDGVIEPGCGNWRAYTGNIATDRHPVRNMEFAVQIAGRIEQDGDDPHRLLRVIEAVAQRISGRR